MVEHDALFYRGERASMIGFIAVAFIGVLKGFVGFTSGSVSLLAQALESFSDLFSLIAIFIGMRARQIRG